MTPTWPGAAMPATMRARVASQPMNRGLKRGFLIERDLKIKVLIARD